MLELFKFQEEGARWLSERRRALLCDEPGLGKTAQGLRAADYAGITNSGVTCPANIVKQWRKNHAEISLNPHGSIEVRSYESARDKGVGASAVHHLDEFHYCKNPSAGRTLALLGRERYGADGAIFASDYVWCYSGTPSPRDPSGLFPIMWAVVPESLRLSDGRMLNRWQFMQKYCVMKSTRNGMIVLRGKNLAELADRLAPFMLRRLKKDVLKDWTKPVCADLWLDSGKAADALAKVEHSSEGQILADIFIKEGVDGLNEYADLDNGISRLRRLTGLIKVPVFIEWIKDQVESGLTKIVIMCYHREVIEAVCTALEAEDLVAEKYWGGMSAKHQDAVKGRFIDNPRAFALVCQIDACGTGMDGVQHATGRMVFLEWSWIGDQNYQALCRLDRIGQKEPVLGQFIGLEGSLDASIMATASRRTAEGQTLFG